MLREIHEQPDAVRRVLAHYTADHCLRNSAWPSPSFTESGPIVIAASGSSRHSGLAAEIMLEDLAAATVDVEYASEYSTRTSHSTSFQSAIVLSQSGETSDTLAALRTARARGLRTVAITNHPESTMATEADLSLPLLAGPELAIPATKSFLCQLIVLHLLALHEAAQQNTLTREEIRSHLATLRTLPRSLAAQLDEWNTLAAELATQTASAHSFLYLGRGIHSAIAREGALKLKESSYVHAEAYPTGELLHGPNALVSPDVPVVVLATFDPSLPDSVLRYQKTLETLAKLRHQRARTLVLANRSDREIAALATHTIPISPLGEYLLAAAEVVPLQLFAYHMARVRGIDMDRPRHLNKAVIEPHPAEPRPTGDHP